MRVAVLYNAVNEEALPDEQDVLVQVDMVCLMLGKLGHKSECIACELNLEEVRRQLCRSRPDVVFNLVESLGGHGQLTHMVPGLLDAMGLPYTGSPAEALFVTSNKIMAKERLRSAGIPTPPWIELPVNGSRKSRRKDETVPAAGAGHILKSVWEHASHHMDDASVIKATDKTQICALLKEKAARHGGSYFAESYIDGREFNISLLGGPTGPEVLHAAEIDFSAFPVEKPRIVGYPAKWDAHSFEYNNTPRRFDFPDPADRKIVESLRQLSLACWDLFDLRGYARVDFRVDSEGRPWVLEANTNPCLSPDAGFAAAAGKTGLTLEQVVERILNEALVGNKLGASEPTHVSLAAGEKDPREAAVLAHRSGSKDRRMPPDISFRYEPAREDIVRVRELVAATGFFSPAEIVVASELVEDRLARGAACGYHFVFAESQGKTAGYVCYGPIACTVSSYDIHWIGVHPGYQLHGVGRSLLQEAERLIRAVGGSRIYIETSAQRRYAGSRTFYHKLGYKLVSIFDDFYAPGDSRATYCKIL